MTVVPYAESGIDECLMKKRFIVSAHSTKSWTKRKVRGWSESELTTGQSRYVAVAQSSLAHDACCNKQLPM